MRPDGIEEMLVGGRHAEASSLPHWGRRITYADPTPWHYWRRMHRRGMPTAMIAVTLGIYTAARFGLAAGMTDDMTSIVGRPPIDFASVAADYAYAWRRGARRPVTDRLTMAG